MPTRIGGELKNFDLQANSSIPKRSKNKISSQFSIAATTEAWQSAALGEPLKGFYDPKKMGCILGVLESAVSEP